MPEIEDYFYQFHKRGGHKVVFYIIKRITASTSYYQYLSVDGYWYIMKEVVSGTTTTTTYTRPVSVTTTTSAVGWTGREDLTYDIPSEVFGEE